MVALGGEVVGDVGGGGSPIALFGRFQIFSSGVAVHSFDGLLFPT